MPTVLAASISRVCGGTLTARPSIVRLTKSGMGNHSLTVVDRIVLVGARFAVQVIFEFVAELLHDGDGRHGGGIAERAEGTTQHVLRNIADQVNVRTGAVPFVEARENFLQPGGAFAARDAPPAT